MAAHTPKEPPPLVPSPVRALRGCARCAQLSQDCTRVGRTYVCPACLTPEEEAAQ